MPPSGAVSRVDRAIGVTVVAVLVVLAAESLLGLAQLGNNNLSVTYRVGDAPGGNESVDLTLENHGPSLSEHVAALAQPSGVREIDHLYFLIDRSYPGLYAAQGDIEFVPLRTQHFLGQMGSPIAVTGVTGSQLPGVLAADPHGALAIVGTPAPSSVLAVGSSQLAQWIRAGGTLFWAGGPLGYSAGYSTPGSPFQFRDLYWQGQIDLAGFSLTDPSFIAPSNTYFPYPAPQLFGTARSPLATTLGILYQGTSDGANVQRLVAHGGYDLGFDAQEGSGLRASERTSLAFVPVGAGGIYFFGGADLSAYEGYVPYAQGWIADGTVEISQDIALLAGLQYVPAPAPAVSADIFVGPGASSHLSLTLRGYLGPVTIVVRSETLAVIFSYWSTLGANPGPSNPAIAVAAAAVRWDP